MDERFRGKTMWIGLGAVAIVFLCVALCGFGAMATLFLRSGSTYEVVPYVQPPAGEEGAVPPPVQYGHGPVGLGRHDGWGPLGILGSGISLIFKLLLLGLLLLLLFGLVKRLLWGRWSWCPPYWHRSPEGKEGESKPQGQGPWAWHHHRKHWGPPPWWGAEPEPAREQDEPDTADDEYTGPQK